MKNGFILFIFLLKLFTSNAQTFQKSYDFCNGLNNIVDGTGYFADEIEDGYLIFASNYYSCLSVIKLDTFGTVVDSKDFDFYPSFTSLNNSFIKDENGDYLVTARTANELFESDVILAKISGKSLDTLWTKRYYLNNYQKPAAIRYAGNNKYTILGQSDSVALDQDGRTQIYTQKFMFMEIDASGNLIDTFLVSRGIQSSVDPGDFHYLPTGEIILVNGDGPNGFYPKGARSLLDKKYNRVWREQFGYSRSSPKGRRPQIAVSPDTSVIYTAWIDYQDQWSGKFGGNGIVQAFTRDNELLWEVCIRSGTFWITSLQVNSKGEIVGCGYDFGASSDYSEGEDRGDRGRIFKLSPEGEKIFDHRFLFGGSFPDNDPEDASLFRHMTLTSDGGFLATGDIKPPNTAPGHDSGDVYVLKLDSNACLAPDCDSIVFKVNTTSSVFESSPQHQIKIYPNPASESININFNPTLGEINLSLFSLTGKKVLQASKIRSGSQINIAHLPKGIYFYQLQSVDNQRVGSGKLVVQ